MTDSLIKRSDLAGLAKPVSLPEAKTNEAKLAGLRTLAKKAGAGLELLNQISEARLWNLRRAGEMLPGLVGKGKKSLTLSDLGINTNESSRWQKLAEPPKDVWQAKIEEIKSAGNKELTLAEMLRLVKVARKKPADCGAGEATAMIMTANDLLAKTVNASIDLIFTDPPYSTDIDDIDQFARDWVPLAIKTLKPTGRMIIFIGAYHAELRAYLNTLVCTVLVWTYKNTIGPRPTHDYIRNWQAILHFKMEKAPPLNNTSILEQLAVHEVNAPDGRRGERIYTYQKPDALSEMFIRHATSPGDLILDPFAGSGTFLAAAARLGRHSIGCDSNEAMVELWKSRGINVQ